MILTPHSLLFLFVLHVSYALGTPSNLVQAATPAAARWTTPPSLQRRKDNPKPNRVVPPEGYYNPYKSGGHLLTEVPVTYPVGQGEPINAIISGNSDPRVLDDNELDGGLRNYFLSLGFSGNCLGQHQGSHQAANLGDGNGSKNETAVMRWNYGDPQLGSCRETIEGGNHFRYWIQDGPEGNSGAVFLAISEEMPLSHNHDIIVNGYNLGRDWLLGNITKSFIETSEVTNETEYSGSTSSAGWTYLTHIKYVSGMLSNTSAYINHNWTVSAGDTINACDGLVAVLHVEVTQAGRKSAAWRPSASAMGPVTVLVLSALLLL